MPALKSKNPLDRGDQQADMIVQAFAEYSPQHEGDKARQNGCFTATWAVSRFGSCIHKDAPGPIFREVWGKDSLFLFWIMKGPVFAHQEQNRRNHENEADDGVGVSQNKDLIDNVDDQSI